MSNAPLPFRTVDAYPARLTAGTVLARLLDGLGFRFYWATEGLTAADYAYRPCDSTKTIGEITRHVWGLANWMRMQVFGEVDGDSRPGDAAGERDDALRMLHRLREHLATLDEAHIAAIAIRDQPVWHLINGPIADALTHVGQINYLRRAAGNPLPKPANVFMLRPPDRD